MDRVTTPAEGSLLAVTENNSRVDIFHLGHSYKSVAFEGASHGVSRRDVTVQSGAQGLCSEIAGPLLMWDANDRCTKLKNSQYSKTPCNTSVFS
jgi:hypothetical protein